MKKSISNDYLSPTVNASPSDSKTRTTVFNEPLSSARRLACETNLEGRVQEKQTLGSRFTKCCKSRVQRDCGEVVSLRKQKRHCDKDLGLEKSPKLKLQRQLGHGKGPAFHSKLKWEDNKRVYI